MIKKQPRKYFKRRHKSSSSARHVATTSTNKCHEHDSSDDMQICPSLDATFSIVSFDKSRRGFPVRHISRGSWCPRLYPAPLGVNGLERWGLRHWPAAKRGTKQLISCNTTRHLVATTPSGVGASPDIFLCFILSLYALLVRPVSLVPPRRPAI